MDFLAWPQILHEESLTLKIGIRERTSISKPLGNEEPPTQHPLQQARQHTTMLCFCDFSCVHRNSRRQNSNRNTSNESSNYEHGHIDSTGLESTTESSDQSTKSDGFLSAQSVCDEEIDDRAENRTSLKGRYDSSLYIIIWLVEVIDEARLREGRCDDTGVVTEQETC